MKPSSIADIDGVIAEPERVTFEAQPIVDLRRGTISGYEVLARFDLASGRRSPPDQVFATAVRAGLGPKLEAVVVERAFLLAKRVPMNCFVAINVDPRHITSDEVAAKLARVGDLGGIVFELTERTTLVDNAALSEAVRTLTRRGAMIAIDDVGSGYAGLQQIVACRPQFIKIDGALIQGMHDNETKRVVVQMLGSLADRLDAWVVAESVESERDLNALAQLGVPLAQGHAIASPGQPWSEISPEGARALGRIRERSEAHASSPPLSLGPLIEPTRTCVGDADWPSAAAVAVRVDKSGRPIEMRLKSEEQGTQLRMEYDLLRVKRSTSMAAVATRVAIRSERVRWDPILCIDDHGVFEGTVSPHRLLTELAHLTQRLSSEVVPAMNAPSPLSSPPPETVRGPVISERREVSPHTDTMPSMVAVKRRREP